MSSFFQFSRQIIQNTVCRNNTYLYQISFSNLYSYQISLISYVLVRLRVTKKYSQFSIPTYALHSLTSQQLEYSPINTISPLFHEIYRGKVHQGQPNPNFKWAFHGRFQYFSTSYIQYLVLVSLTTYEALIGLELWYSSFLFCNPSQGQGQGFRVRVCK